MKFLFLEVFFELKEFYHECFPVLPKLRCGKCGGCMKVKAICKLSLDRSERLGDAGR